MAALADGCCLSFVAGTLVRLAESYMMTDEQREQGGRVRSFLRMLQLSLCGCCRRLGSRAQNGGAAVPEHAHDCLNPPGQW